MICPFIDQMRARKYKVESICRVLTAPGMQVAPRKNLNWRTAPLSERVVTSTHLTGALLHTVDTAEGLYGRRKMTAHLRRSGHQVASCTLD